MLTIVITMTFAGTQTAFGASSKSSKYWVKVNAKANVVTVYKKVDKKWKPYRAMLCSTGTGKGDSYEATPVGSYRVSSRWDWGPMVGGVYARYVVQFYGDFLFHSVPYEEYKNPKSMPAKEYNKLGKDASHGCVRLSLMDAKWVYDNIPRGTKVTVYNSKNPGPLGKPKGIKLPKKPKLTWDPTDPSKKNTKYQLPKPVIKIADSKKLEVQIGKSYKLKSGVTAQDPNTFQNLTGLLQVYKVKKYDPSKKKYIEAKFSTKKEATYKVTYRVKYKYGGTTYKTIKIKVVDKLKAPTISGAKDRTVTLGDTNAVSGVTAKQYDCARTSSIKVYIQAPGEVESKAYTYSEATSFQFDKEGEYKVRYVVKNKYKPYRSTTKTVTITSVSIEINENNEAPLST
ncbi:MAG: L,D-transpeptidase [Firmicutes bacterium]|nr:L,D-transpeptidase [Bacillota bacterium]